MSFKLSFWYTLFLYSITLLGVPAFTSPLNDNTSIIFTGDFSFGENYFKRYGKVGEKSILDERGYESFLEPFNKLLRKSDLNVTNLETPLTDLRSSPFKKSYKHWSDPKKTTSALRKFGFKLVSLGNNHALDIGVSGLNDTFKALKDSGIEHIGAGLNSASASKPFLTTLRIGEAKQKLAIFASFERFDGYVKKYNWYATISKPGVAALDTKRLHEEIKTLRFDDPDIFVIAYPHWVRIIRCVQATSKSLHIK